MRLKNRRSETDRGNSEQVGKNHGKGSETRESRIEKAESCEEAADRRGVTVFAATGE
jgi:hypothetical protein